MRKNSKEVISWRKRLKKRATDLFGGKCQGCGYDVCVEALHFHHVDSSKKEFGISGKTISWNKIFLELKKCVLLCGNCHTEVGLGLRICPLTPNIVNDYERCSVAIKPRYSRKCPGCDKEFFELDSSKRKFCSKDCRNRNRKNIPVDPSMVKGPAC